MSLQIWMPLINDLHNQGLSNVSITATNVTQSDDGKLGKCYQFTAANSSRINIAKEALTSNTEVSIAMWVKFTNWNGGIRDYIFSANDSGGNAYTDQFFSITRNSAEGTPEISTSLVVITNGSGLAIASGEDIPAKNTWFHITCTYKNSILTCYLNGQQVAQKTNANITFANITNIKIGGSYSANYSNILVNDFRLYDHCLSAKEVEEISKGLVVHYMLSPQNLIGNLTTGQVINSAGNAGTPSNTAAWAVTDYIPISPGDTYLAEQLSAGGSGGRIGLYDSSKTNIRTISITANQSNTITAADNERYIRLSIRTTSDEANLNPMLYQTNGMIYDCSGYCNNGNIIGNITYTSPSPRYSNAMQFDGTSNAIAAGRGGMVKDAISVAWWGYMDDWSNFKKCISSLQGGGYGFEPYSSGTRLGFSVYNLNSSNTATVVRSYIYLSSVTANCWHHFVGTFDGNNVNLYKNGKLVNSTTALDNKIIYNETNGLFIGAEAGDSATVPAEWVSGMKPIKISDFRIYSTALTENQVKELYNTSMAIDANGNIFARELVEE